MKNTLISLSLTASLLALTPTSALAKQKPSINEMQGCQAIIDFVEAKLQTTPQYDKADIDTVLKGLGIYDRFIQDTIVTPGLLEFNGGDKAKADAMQKQVDAYKAQVKTAYDKRYPQARLFTDHAVAVNECAKKVVPEGADLEALKQAVMKMVELAKKG